MVSLGAPAYAGEVGASRRCPRHDLALDEGGHCLVCARRPADDSGPGRIQQGAGGVLAIAVVLSAGFGLGVIEQGIRTADDAPTGATSSQIGLRSVVLLPDTQFYSCAYPEVFTAQTRWIVEQHEHRAIGLALHTGDVVDRNIASQWQVAGDALELLDGKVPYLVALGNHDVDRIRNSLASRYLRSQSGRGGTAAVTYRSPDSLDNAYVTIELGGERWLFISIEYGARDEVVRWGQDVLERHDGVPTVLITHAYLFAEAQRYDRQQPGEQRAHPDIHGFDKEAGVADGQDLYSGLVEPYDQVRLVMSGHVIPHGIARSTAVRDSGAVVHEVLTNFQRCPSCPCEPVRGGNGYLRLLEFGPDGSVAVSTYSPHLDRWLDDPEHRFVLRWPAASGT